MSLASLAEFASEVLDAERASHAAEQVRLQQIIDRLAGERALMEAERNRLAESLRRVQTSARHWQTLQSHCHGSLADDFADQIDVQLEDYQDDGSGRRAVCLDQDEITVDLREEDFVPREITVEKRLPDGNAARFTCRLQAGSLRYDVQYVD